MQQREKKIIFFATASAATPQVEEVGGWPLKELIVGSEKGVCVCVCTCVSVCGTSVCVQSPLLSLN